MKVIIVGTDEFGKHVYDCMMERKDEYEVLGFTDWELKASSEKFCGKSVWSLDEIVQLYSNEDINFYLAITTNRYLSLAIAQLRKQGIRSVYLVPLYVLEKKKNIFSEDLLNTEKIQKLDLELPILAHLETHVVDSCNFKCKACNNFSPLYKKTEVTVEQFTHDLKILREKFGTICRIYLLGGEPFLDTDRLIYFVNQVRELFPNTELRVITNGTCLFSVQSDVLDRLRKLDAILQISLYPPMARKKEQLDIKLQDYGIKHIISQEVTHFVKRLMPEPVADSVVSEKRCGSSGCTFFRNGKLSKCPDAILVEAFDKKFGTTFKSHDTVNIDESMNGFDVEDKINAPIDMCKYCTQYPSLIEWEQIKGEPQPQDWLVDNTNNEASIEQEIYDLKQRLYNVDKRNKAVEERNRAVEQRNSDLEERNRAVEQRNSDLEERNRAVEQRNSDLEERNRAVEQRNSDLEERNRHVEDYNKKMEVHIMELNGYVEELSYYNQQLKEKNQDISERLNELESSLVGRFYRLFSFKWVKKFLGFIKNNLKKIFVVGVALFLMCGSVFYQYTTFSRNNVIISSSKTKVSTVANTNGNIIVELNNEKMHSLDSEDGYYLSYHILTSQGDYYSYDGLRTPIKVSPKSKREVELQYLAPSVEGNYILQVDIVKENVAWLSTEGNQTLDIEMQVVK